MPQWGGGGGAGQVAVGATAGTSVRGGPELGGQCPRHCPEIPVSPCICFAHEVCGTREHAPSAWPLLPTRPSKYPQGQERVRTAPGLGTKSES